MALSDGYLVKVNGAVAAGEQPMSNAGAIVTEVGDPGADTNFPTEQAVREALTANAALAVATYAANQTLSAAECGGYVIYVTGAATITLPAIASGMSVTIITVGAVAVSVDPNASDKIVLDGTALDDGDKITNLSTAGDIAVLTYYSADGWHASTNGWTDGGA